MGRIWQGTDGADRIDIRNTDFTVVWAKGGNDTVVGNDLENDLSGANQNDYLAGEGGDDFIKGEGDRDTIYGGLGNDRIFGGYANFVFGGTDDGADQLYGDEGDDYIKGEYGNDRIWGGTGNDYIDAGEDDDIVYGENGNDTIEGWANNDSLFGGEGDDSMEGGDGLDYIEGNGGNDNIRGGDGDNILLEKLLGGSGDDLIRGDFELQYSPSIHGDLRNFKYFFPRTKDEIWGDSGNDTIEGMGNNDVIRGGDGNDLIYGDYINNRQLIDEIIYGNDWIDGGSGNDTVYGGEFSDTLLSGGGTDVLFGGNGNDVIQISGDPNQQGLSILAGGEGDDLIIGGNHSTLVENLDLSGELRKELNALKDFIKTLENANNVVPKIGEFIDAGKGFDTVEAGAGTDIIYAGLPTSANTNDKVQLIYGNAKQGGIPEPDVFVITTVALSKQEQFNQAIVQDSLNLAFKGLKILVTIYDIAGYVVPGGKIPSLLFDMGVYGVDVWKFVEKYSGGKPPDEPSILDKMTVIKDFDPGLDVLYLDNGGGKIRYVLTGETHVIGNQRYDGIVIKDAQGTSAQPRIMLDGLKYNPETLVFNFGQSSQGSPLVGLTIIPNLASKPTSLYQDPIAFSAGESIITGKDDDVVEVRSSLVKFIYTGAGKDKITVDSNQNVFAGVGNDQIYAGINLGDNRLTGGAGKDQFWFYDDHGAEVINMLTNVLTNNGSLNTEVIEEYADSFGDGNLNIITDFNPEEDVIGFTDFLVPLGLNSGDFRQVGDDVIISLFERDIIRLENVQVEDLTPEHFVIDNSFFDRTFSGLINENPEPNRLIGTNQSDTISGSASNDLIEGYQGSDLLFGYEGNDILLGQEDEDTLEGGVGNDILDGGASNDKLFGESGDDQLFGQEGDDFLMGGKGEDLLRGQAGKDTFILQKGYGSDLIEDFTQGEDLIGLADGLRRSDLTINRVDNSTQIIETASNEILAVLTGITSLNTSDFILWT